MTNTEITSSSRPLSPRQDRLESAIVTVLRSGGTRSSLRVLVEEFADHARVRGNALEDAVGEVKALAMRAGPELEARGDVGESIADRMVMMTRWLRLRYLRAD